MTVAELVAELQGLDPDAVIVGPAGWAAGLLAARAGWYCPGLVADGSDDFWGDEDYCSNGVDGRYAPRPQDRRAVWLGSSED